MSEAHPTPGSARLRAIVEGLTAASIVLGLVLVFWQLRQSHFLTDMQLNVETTHQLREINLAVLGEDFSSVLARSLEAPETLDTADHLELDVYYSSLDTYIAGERWRAEQGLFDVAELDLETLARRFFGSPYARNWWRANRSDFGPPDWPVRRAIDAAIAPMEGDATLERIENLRSGFERR